MILRGSELPLGVNKNIQKFVVVMDTQLCEFAKSH